MARKTIAGLERTIGELKMEIARLKRIAEVRRQEKNREIEKLDKIQAVLNGEG